jgi:hypothetical protein
MNLKTEVVTNLAVDQSLILNGPGTVKVTAAKTVTISKIIGTDAATGHLGTLGAIKLGATLPALGPIFGFTILSAGALLLVKQWIKKVDRGEC